MVRRKAVSLIKGMGNVHRRMLPIPSSGIPITSNLQESLIDNINRFKEAAAQEALSKYNAEDFNSTIVIPNDATYVAHDVIPKQIALPTNRRVIKSAMQPVKNYTGNQRAFVNDIYNSYYRTLTKGGTSDSDAKRQAKFLAQKAAFETGYGSHMANTHNYGGHRTKDKGWLSFDSMDAFTERDVKLLDKKWSNWRNSKTDKDFVKAITTNNGQGIYAPENEYKDYYGLSNRVNSYLNMGRRDLRCGGKARPKAWIGAAIGAATSLLGGILSSNAQERQQRELRRQQEHNAAIERAQGLTESLGLMQAAQKEYEDRFRVGYAKGGRRSLKNGFTITDGGYGVQIGNDTFLLRGGSHEDVNETGQTGIGLKIGGRAKGKEIEAEGGEVVQKTPNEIRVFSDTLGINGKSFAELVRLGYDKNKLFKIQQAMNGDYGSNRRRLRNGGYISSPVGRNMYATGGTTSKYLGSNLPSKSWWRNVVNAVNTGLSNTETTNIPDVITPDVTTTPVVDKQKGRLYTDDLISFGADIFNSLFTAYNNYNAASNLQDPVAPVRVSPGKLITNYNIAPRLAEASMMRGRMLRDSDESVSSAARLNRRNAVNMYTNNYIDRLYGEKTNREIEMLNADTMNQQRVNAQNVAAYNDYTNRLIASRDNRNLSKAAAIQMGISGIGDSIANAVDQNRQNRADDMVMTWGLARLGDSDREWAIKHLDKRIRRRLGV